MNYIQSTLIILFTWLFAQRTIQFPLPRSDIFLLQPPPNPFVTTFRED